ncbi:MAG: futalosine hydrolase [Bacteroidales bacterium]|nr:futalosine hydrolase [Bacteroidales bacterium]
MKLLLVSATDIEIAPFLFHLGKGQRLSNEITRYEYAENTIDVLVTGVGMIHTTFFLGKYLNSNKPDLVINAGICGCFNDSISIGSVVNVVSDSFPEIGSESSDSFIPWFDLKLEDPQRFPFSDGKLVNPYKDELLKELDIPRVEGATVNTVHGNELSIQKFTRLFQPLVESMEGAAFMYVCLQYGVQFLQIRSVSNKVEVRNTEKWNIKLAISNLNAFLLKFLAQLDAGDA